MPPNETFVCCFLLAKGIINLEIYTTKRGFCPSKVLAQAGIAPKGLVSYVLAVGMPFGCICELTSMGVTGIKSCFG